MRIHYLCLAIAFALRTTCAFAASFSNLDFEQATVRAAPASYVPFDAIPPISASDALPGWTVTEDNTICNAIWGQPIALDETSVALVASNAIQGKYDVQLFSYVDAPQEYFHIASISQTAAIPAGTQSIRFSVRSPAVAGRVSAIPIVTVNNTPITVFEVSNAGGIQQWGGNVSPFAGTSGALAFTAAGIPGDFPGDEDIYELDSISFSSLPVPEPKTFIAILLINIPVILRLRASAPSRPNEKRTSDPQNTDFLPRTCARLRDDARM